jgi:hypothetical protein
MKFEGLTCERAQRCGRKRKEAKSAENSSFALFVSLRLSSSHFPLDQEF